MAREVHLEAFAAALAAGEAVVDVREPGEYLAGHVPGARLMPLGALAGRIGELPAGRPVYVICAGGTSGWARTGRPLVTGPHATAV